MSTATTTTPFPNGTLVRVTETHDVGEETISKGEEFTVSDYWGGDAQGREGYIDFPFYYGDARGGMNNLVAAADKVELVKTAEQMNARRIPTPEEIVAELHCMDNYDGFEITAADRPDGASRELSGYTKDGLFFACTITISNVYQGDE